MKKVVKQDASPASNSRRLSRDLSADNSCGKRVTRNANIMPKKKTITPNASPASSSRRSSRKQTKETTPTNVRKSVRLENMSKLKETLSNLISYECKSNSSKFVEFRVPVQISNVQLEQYCSMLLSNAMALGSCSKT
nr:helicase protein MOM1-like isoform X1 [Tanacetum cinerariifolium]